MIASAQEVVAEFSNRKGMHKNQVVARVMGWFASQSPVIQSLIVGLVDDEMSEAYAEALEAMIAHLRAKSGGRKKGKGASGGATPD